MLRYFLDSILGPPYSKIDFEGLANPNVAVKRESESDLVRRKSSTRLRFEMRSYTNCLLRYTANMGIHGRAFLLYFLEQKYSYTQYVDQDLNKS